MKRKLYLPPSEHTFPPPVEVVIRVQGPLDGVLLEELSSPAGRKRAQKVFRRNADILRSTLLMGVPVRVEHVKSAAPRHRRRT